MREAKNLERVEDVFERIDRVVVQTNFVVKVWAGGAAGRSDVGDDVAAFDMLAGLSRVRREMPVACRVPVAVGDIDDVAVSVGPLGLDDDAIGGSANGLAGR